MYTILKNEFSLHLFHKMIGDIESQTCSFRMFCMTSALEFFFKNDLQNNKYRNVKICNDYFYDLLPEDRKRFVDLLVNYRNDKLKKKKLINYIETKISNPFIKNYSLFLIRLNKF